MTKMCEKHEDVPYITRSSGSVNGGNISWGCAVCNMLKVEQLRDEARKWQWQPIRWAPKDGTSVLTIVAGFEPSITAWQEHFGISRWAVDPETFMTEEEFRVYFCQTQYHPTHFMPLPAGPASQPEGSQP